MRQYRRTSGAPTRRRARSSRWGPVQVFCAVALLQPLPSCNGGALSPPAPGGTASMTEAWILQGYCVGVNAGNEDGVGSVLMPNVLRLPVGTYRMFYNKSMPDDNQIRYAESSDGVTWAVKGVVLRGSADPSDRTYILGGPSVVRLPDGRHRMYYRVSPQTPKGTPPGFHIRSAISTDGVTFEEEPGIRIDIASNDPASPLQLAGHGSFFVASDGRYAGIFSGNLVGDNGPSDLFLTTSTDGLLWGNFKMLHDGYHDPTVVKVGDQYHLFSMYLHLRHTHWTSHDGLSWPTEGTDVSVVDANGVDQTNQGAGDWGAAVDPTGQIRIYTNYGNPSVDIVYFKKK